jgi:hypothetical protein
MVSTFSQLTVPFAKTLVYNLNGRSGKKLRDKSLTTDTYLHSAQILKDSLLLFLSPHT